MPNEPAIFISYRRRDAGGHGRAVHEYLSRRFGNDRVFFDRSTIESGDMFPDTLRQGVERCAVLLALIGPDWLDVRGDDGGRRLDDANDFVHREIALALEQGKRVIPVLFDDTPVPPRDRLPDPLKPLASRDALTLRGKTYEYQTQRQELVRLLAKVPGVPQPLPEVEPDSNRVRMLAEVRRIWIDGYLKESLHNLVRIELGLEETPGAVSRPWDLIVQPPYQAPRPLPPGQAMGTVFDELGQALLILGTPGAGKTTLLLELTRDLLDRAAQDATHPIPVVFHLSSWAARQRPLVDWLADELTGRYYVPRKLAQEWANAEKVLPLLDGLDEVALEHREACVEAINAFRREHPLVAFAVCSRAAEYEELRVRLELSGAVFIRPLSREQIGAYLREAGKPLAGVRTVLRDDETLWEFLETPLMLSIVALTYQGRSASEVRATGSLEQRRTHLFENYIRRMFERRSKVTAYTPEQTIRWLTWLARSLMYNNVSVFYLEWIQPDWLPSRAQRRIVAMVPIMFSGLVFGMVSGLISGLTGGLVNGLIGGIVLGLIVLILGLILRLVYRLVYRLVGGLADRLIYRLTAGLIILVGGLTALKGLLEGVLKGVLEGVLPPRWLAGLLIVLAIGLIVLSSELKSGLDHITPAEALRWSWRRARRYWIGGLVSGMVFGLVLGMALWVVHELIGGMVLGLVFGLYYGLVFGLTGGLIGGLTTGQILIRTLPNEGIRRSLRNALITFLTGGLVGGLVGSLGGSLGSSLVSGTALGLFQGLIGGLVFGGSAYLKHHVLRILFWCNNYAPWNYIPFLNYAAERVFLRKVGGGYIFTHRLLMEHFATLQPPDQARQIKAE